MHLLDWMISLKEDRETTKQKKQNELASAQLATLRNNSSEG